MSMQKLFYRNPIWGWRNDGSAIPYRLRGKLTKRRNGSVWLYGKRQVSKYHWVIITHSGDIFVFARRSIDRLYWIGMPSTGSDTP